MVYCEFQAVILAAGRGSRMTDITSGTPKCLLPVGGKPILCHSIGLLEKAGFKDVIVVVLENELNQIHQALVHNNVTINFDLSAIPEDCEDWGTADSLRHLISQDKIKNDVLVMSCDLFTNANINKLLCVYRQHSASFAALFFLPVQGQPFEVPGVKSKYKAEKDIIGIDLETSRLMFLVSASDFEENVSINSNMLRRHPNLNLRTDLIDGHLYLMSHKLIEYLAMKKGYSTLKGEFLPHVVGKQHVRKFVGNDESSVLNDTSKKTLSEYMTETKIEENIIELSTYNDHEGDLKKAYHGDVIRCYAVIADENNFGIRINSLQSLCQANWLCTDSVVNVGIDITGVKINPSATVESNQVDSGSFIGSNCRVKEKTSIKTSVLGDSTVVNPKTRISRCIILKNTEILEGCVLDNCIVANDVEIGTGCELKSCLIGPHFRVPNGTKATRQVLVKSEDLMEI
ncbi:hypothetical protein RUM44_013527 [Polyplax serrata]|uniref:Translation initiation factor eIF2B subunit gamma n=1 Tax=Polyplax serrata TaxID=468196 RepID=A0ABR1BIN7_POLSC